MEQGIRKKLFYICMFISIIVIIFFIVGIIIFKVQVVRYTIHSNKKITGNRTQLAFA